MDARPSLSRVVLSPIVGFIGNTGYVLVTVVGAMMILGGELLVGDLQAFIRYLRQLSDPINETVSIVNVLQSTVAAAERIFEVLDADEEIPEREPPAIPPEQSLWRGGDHRCALWLRAGHRSDPGPGCTRCSRVSRWPWWAKPAPARPPLSASDHALL